MYPDGGGALLHASFLDVSQVKLLCNFGKIARLTLILLRGRARDYFEISNLRQTSENFVLYAVGKVGIRFFLAQVFKGKHRDAFLRNRRSCGSSGCRRSRRAVGN